jgi:hypothetical protein
VADPSGDKSGIRSDINFHGAGFILDYLKDIEAVRRGGQGIDN